MVTIFEGQYVGGPTMPRTSSTTCPPDGQRFLMIKESEGFKELRRLVPMN